MAEIIAISNQKGGVGKTTSTLNLGAAIHQLGHRVLLVDLDPQGSLTLSAGFVPDDLEKTIFQMFEEVLSLSSGGASKPDFAFVEDTKPVSFEQLPILTSEEGLQLIPSNIELSRADFVFSARPGGYVALRDLLQAADSHYDYILLDCPPSLGILTANGLVAANRVVIPLQADYLALKGVYLLLRTIADIRRSMNPQLKIGGVFITMADTRLIHTNDMIETTQTSFAGKVHVFKTIVRMNAPIKESPIAGQSILTYSPSSVGAQAYRDLALEIIG